VEVPTTEDVPRRPFGDYGCRKAAIERYLLDEAASGRLPASVLHPGHLVGPGWSPINPAGNFNPRVFEDLSRQRPVRLPNFGLETLHHVHADDVAQAFERAAEQAEAAIGESFHVVSPAALTLRGYAEGMAAWYGVEPLLEFVPYGEWKAGVSERDAEVTLDHLRHSPHCSIAKARSRLGYAPRYTSLAAVQDSLQRRSGDTAQG
jgi:nucleoside-diphosphate-sugar epimerase